MVRPCRLFVRVCINEIPIREIHFLLTTQIVFGTTLRIVIREVCAGGFFVERVMHGVQGAVWFQDDPILFVLRIPEVTDVPESRRNLVAINAVRRWNSDGLPQILVCIAVEWVAERYR